MARRALDERSGFVRVGVLADTHLPSTIRELWPEVTEVFAGVDLILHAGDLVTSAVLDTLEETAPTLAARGNGDGRVEDPRLDDLQLIELAGWRIAMVHDLEPEDRPLEYLRKWYLRGEEADIVISGHTHYERIVRSEDVLWMNPGSPTHPHLWSTRLGTVGLLELAPGEISARILRLGESEGLRNPAAELNFRYRPLSANAGAG